MNYSLSYRNSTAQFKHSNQTSKNSTSLYQSHILVVKDNNLTWNSQFKLKTWSFLNLLALVWIQQHGPL